MRGRNGLTVLFDGAARRATGLRMLSPSPFRQPLLQRHQVAPCRPHGRINKTQGRRVRKYFKEGSDHLLLSDGTYTFQRSWVIGHQKHCFVMHCGD